MKRSLSSTVAIGWFPGVVVVDIARAGWTRDTTNRQETVRVHFT